MKRKTNIIKYSLLAISLIFLFFISYLRFTYYINPNLSGDPILIKISEANMNMEPIESGRINDLDINTWIRGRSIMVFWLIFGLANLLFCFLGKDFKQNFMPFIISYAGFTFLILIFAGLHFILSPEVVFYKLFSIIKNFLLSPLYTGVIFIFVRFFNRIVQ